MEYRCLRNKIMPFLILLLLNNQSTEGKIWPSYTSDGQQSESKCSGNKGLKYLWGDALIDSRDCIGPNKTPYPSAIIDQTFTNLNGSARRGRKLQTRMDPAKTRSILLKAFQEANSEDYQTKRYERSLDNSSSFGSAQCREAPARLCKTTYNTTAPMYGVSLTSGQPVTIVQKFPDLLQQVVYEVCESSDCEVVRGECTQTYVPYLFLVIPLGPVTLTGQDYILVESGCVCKPKQYGTIAQGSNMIP